MCTCKNCKLLLTFGRHTLGQVASEGRASQPQKLCPRRFASIRCNYHRSNFGTFDIEWTFLGCNPTQLTASSSSFQNEIPKTVRNRFFVKESVVPYPNPAFLHERLQTPFTEHTNVGLLFEHEVANAQGNKLATLNNAGRSLTHRLR
jgi:hypothetical protein